MHRPSGYSLMYSDKYIHSYNHQTDHDMEQCHHPKSLLVTSVPGPTLLGAPHTTALRPINACVKGHMDGSVTRDAVLRAGEAAPQIYPLDTTGNPEKFFSTSLGLYP